MGVYIKKLQAKKVEAIFTMLGLHIEDGDIIEVKAPHGRLIEADDVNERIRKRLGIRNLDYLLEAEKPIAMSIKESPTVIEAEVE